MIQKTFRNFFLPVGIAILFLLKSFFLNGQQIVTFHTGNPNAIVYVNDFEEGRGDKVKIKLKRDNEAQQIRVEAEGYIPAYYCAIQSEALKAYKSTYEIPVTQKDFSRPEGYKYLYVDNFYFDYDAFDVRSEGIHYNEFKWDSYKPSIVTLDPENIKRSREKGTQQPENPAIRSDIKTYLQKKGLVDTVNALFKDYSRCLILTGQMEYLKFCTVYPNKDALGKAPEFKFARATVRWEIRNIYDEIIKTVKITSTSGQYASDADNVEKTDRKLPLKNVLDNSLYILLTDSITSEIFKIIEEKIDIDSLSLKRTDSVVSTVSEAQSATVILRRLDDKGKDDGLATGFAITNDGYILTNYHVVVGNDPNSHTQIIAQTAEGKSLDVTLVRYNVFKDIALLRVDAEFKKCFSLPQEKNYKAFEEMFTIGTPKSIELSQSLAKGTLSNDRKTAYVHFLQLNMSINSGNSGGPLFSGNTYQLVGMINAKLTGYGVEGIAFAIPAYKISEYLNLTFD